jgi:hypothetical protein
LDVAGVYQGKTVAFRILILPTWTEKTDPIPIYWGHAALLSSGASSDSLVEIIDSIYGTKLAAKKFKQQISVEAVCLQGDPTHLDSDPIKLKLFFDSGDDAKYAEIYLNIDLAQERASLNEKDPEYRKNIVRALSQ